jgi:pyrimidine operon attenuation protein/uracil phosphoribosyltransferase
MHAMPQTKTLVLSTDEVALKIQRVAWEIYERHLEAEKIVLVGIANSGFWFAQRLHAVLKTISDQEIVLVEMEIHKKDPFTNACRLSIDMASLKNQNVVLIDDVLNSGKVLMYGAKYLLDQPLKKLTTAVLVDRNHKRFPIKADVKGLSLSTSLNEHVEVAISTDGAEVYLH